jgi:16S rRNA (cytosine967-C5)-methyltransferase
MTPAARIQAAIEILDALSHTDQPADRLLRDWFRTRRYAGSKDRAAVGERVFTIERHRSALAWRMQDDSPRALAIASVLNDVGDPAELFTGAGYAPAALTRAEQDAIAATPPEAPVHVQGEYPPFLEPELRRAFGDRMLEEMIALQDRAPVDLRVNTLKTTREDVIAALREEAREPQPTNRSPVGVRLSEGSAALGRSALFESGAFEFQDEAAQIASQLCGATPGDRVLDLAAGAGGKSLALAALMENEGEIVATDIRAAALEELAKRALRAGASIIQPTRDAEGEFDIVLLDSPCSGSGTWRRQPELRWRLTPELLSTRMKLQDELLDRAARHVRPGGRLVYATCSILPCENQDRIAAFRARHPAFEPAGEDFLASPHSTNTDGFFTAVLINTPAASRALDKKEG